MVKQWWFHLTGQPWGEKHEEVRLRLIHCDAPESLECLLVDPGTEVRAAASVDWLANLNPFLVRKCY